MLTYSAEKSIAHLINNNKCKVVSSVNEIDPSETNLASAYIHYAKAFKNDKTPKDDDLFFNSAILVSTAANANDDIFIPSETWASRKSIVDKMTNLEHDNDVVIGHTTAQFIIGEDGSILDNAGEKPPADFFHIGVDAVIYQNRESESSQAVVSELLEGIRNNEYSISMEATFENFDYGVINADRSNINIIERNESTAFLSQHLKVFGGEGEFEGNRIGRVLKDFRFGAFGYVKNPAEPNAKIFSIDKPTKTSFSHNKKEKNLANCTSEGVYNISNTLKNGEKSMSDVFEKQVDELKAEVRKLADANDKLQDDLAKAGVDKLHAEIVDLKERLASSMADLKTQEKLRGEADDAKACMCDKVTELETSKSKVETQLTEVLKANREAQRTSILKSLNFKEDEVEKTLAEFDEMPDSIFNLFADKLSENQAKHGNKDEDEKKKVEDKVKEKMSKSDKDEDVAKSTEIDVEKEGIVIASTSTVDPEDDEMKELASAVAGMLENGTSIKFKKEDK